MCQCACVCVSMLVSVCLCLCQCQCVCACIYVFVSVPISECKLVSYGMCLLISPLTIVLLMLNVMKGVKVTDPDCNCVAGVCVLWVCVCMWCV